MTTTTITELASDVDTLQDFLHGVHLECQADAFVVTACGIPSEWDGYKPDSEKPECPICWSVDDCAMCGVSFL